MSAEPIDKKIDRIYDFLLNNRSYNTTVQRRFYSEALAEYESPEDKRISILYKVQATQSQPKLNNVAKFWKMYHGCIPRSFCTLIKITEQSELSFILAYL